MLILLLAGMLPSWPIGGALSAHALQASQPAKEAVIVEVARGDNPQAVAQALGVVPTHVYTKVFQGFAAELPAGAVRAAERQRGVTRIWPDLPVQAEAQILPTGVNRVDADKNPWADINGSGGEINADVAVLDTGIDTAHPDLNVAGGEDCSGDDTNNWNDGNGHGTHVAGTIAAEDNTIGVVGVAPGARLWAVKVLDDRGIGLWSEVICGLDWVVTNVATIDVVNLSLSAKAEAADQNPCVGGAETTPQHKAICGVVNAGVPVVVAAGNQGKNASTRAPATYEEVITVSAFRDLNGKPGGGGKSKQCGRRGDDTFASFSNYGQDVDIAAPGVCIRSTWPEDKYESVNGTSMATSHVTGAVALYIALGTGDRTPDAVRTWLLTEASRRQKSRYGFTGDQGRGRERVLYLGAPVSGTANLNRTE